MQFTAQNSANAGFANFDAFGQSSGSSNFGGFPTASQSSFQPQNTGRTPSTFDQYLIEIIPYLFVGRYLRWVFLAPATLNAVRLSEALGKLKINSLFVVNFLFFPTLLRSLIFMALYVCCLLYTWNNWVKSTIFDHELTVYLVSEELQTQKHIAVPK